jgi:hypothetical protein
MHRPVALFFIPTDPGLGYSGEAGDYLPFLLVLAAAVLATWIFRFTRSR